MSIVGSEQFAKLPGECGRCISEAMPFPRENAVPVVRDYRRRLGARAEEQCEFLQPERCDALQEYLFAKPMPVEQFLLFFNSARPERSS